MKYYIEKDAESKIVAKGITVDDAVLNDGQIELSEEEFVNVVQYMQPAEEISPTPTFEERLSSAEETINFLLGL